MAKFGVFGVTYKSKQEVEKERKLWRILRIISSWFWLPFPYPTYEIGSSWACLVFRGGYLDVVGVGGVIVADLAF